MKQLPGESYEEWVKRVEQYEFGRALMMLADGADPIKVMEETSYRMMNKLRHSIIKAINDSAVSNYNHEESLEQYRRNYQSRFGPKPDHIADE